MYCDKDHCPGCKGQGERQKLSDAYDGDGTYDARDRLDHARGLTEEEALSSRATLAAKGKRYGGTLRKVLKPYPDGNGDSPRERLGREALGPERTEGYSDGKTFGYIVKGYREHEHDYSVYPYAPLARVERGAPLRASYELVGEPHKKRPGDKAERHGDPRRDSVGPFGTLYRGLQKRPEARRDHDPCGKAEHKVKDLLICVFEKNNGCRAECRHGPGPDRGGKSVEYCLIHVCASFLKAR